MKFKVFLFLFMVLAPVYGSMPVAAQEQTRQDHVKISLIPEFSELTPAMPLMVAVKQEIDEGWHTYWRNPGDSGSAPRVEWDLPDGFEVAQLYWPVPGRIDYGPLVNYGYENEVTLLQEIRVPGEMPEGPVTITADVEILVCKEICIPEYYTLSLTLNDGSEANNTDIITDAFTHLPVDVNWGARYSVNDNNEFVIDLDFELPGLVATADDSVSFDLLPYEWGIIDNTARTFIKLSDDKKTLVLRKARGDRPLKSIGALGLLVAYDVYEGERGALEITAHPDTGWLAARAEEETGSAQQSEAEDHIREQVHLAPSSIGFAQALFFALLGGLILNLMPCVFPILSMKALSLVNMSQKSHASTRMHGISYTAGILFSFAAVAILLIGLQAAGEQIGWGFQLQNPLVVLMLSYLLFMIGLNLSGFYEISGSFTNVGAGLGRKESVKESFFTGILATLVATPCTAPFMGVAMGFALTQPAVIALVVFLALGLGLALPYLLLSFFPALRAFLPKPGAWMIVFRELLAFPVYASVVWLIWVYSLQTGTMGLLYALCGLVGISFAVWIFRYEPKEGTGRAALHGLAFLVLFTVLTITINESLRAGDEYEASPAQYDFGQVYTPDAYQEALAGDNPVFVNMTAAWCISCKVNERVALDVASTRRLFEENNVTYLKGDWTNQDKDITTYLARYGRNGVPIYVFYGARRQDGNRPAPVVMAQFLTPRMIEDLFENEGEGE